MAYMSDLMADPSPMWTRAGCHLEDLIASIRGEMRHPVIVALAVKRASGLFLVPFPDVVALTAPAIPLSKRLQDVAPYEPGEHDLYLGGMCSTSRSLIRTACGWVRVNDLELARVNGHFYVAMWTLAGGGCCGAWDWPSRRRRWSDASGESCRRASSRGDDVELLSGDQPMRLKVPGEKITNCTRPTWPKSSATSRAPRAASSSNRST